jgi:hypothetical protein
MVLVTDPFAGCTRATLSEAFPDLAAPFKEHFIVDLRSPVQSHLHAHHKRNVSASLRSIAVEKCNNPPCHSTSWIALYANLIKRHHIKGTAAFSDNALVLQLQAPGTLAFRAMSRDTTVGMILWYVRDEVAYYHLGAYCDEGYRLKASYALFFESLSYLAKHGVRWADIGAGAGLSCDGTDGLSRFKSGWATETRTAYLCGKVFDPVTYRMLCSDMRMDCTGYFPGYRKPRD